MPFSSFEGIHLVVGIIIGVGVYYFYTNSKAQQRTISGTLLAAIVGYLAVKLAFYLVYLY